MTPWYKDWVVWVMVGVMSFVIAGFGFVMHRKVAEFNRIEREAKDACSPYQVEHYWLNDDNELMIVCRTETGLEVR